MPQPRKHSPRHKSRRSRSRSYSPKQSRRKRSKSHSRSPKRRSRSSQRKPHSKGRNVSRSPHERSRSPRKRSRSPKRRSQSPHYPIKRPADSSVKRTAYRSRSRSWSPPKKVKDDRYDREESPGPRRSSAKGHRSPSPPRQTQMSSSRRRSPSPYTSKVYMDKPSSSKQPLFPVEKKKRREIDYVKIIDLGLKTKLDKRFETLEQIAQGGFDFDENITIGIHRGPSHIELDEDVPVSYEFNPKTFIMLFPKGDFSKPIFDRDEIKAFHHDDILDEEAYKEKRTITVKPSEKHRSKYMDEYKITVGQNREGYGDKRMVQDSRSKRHRSRSPGYEQEIRLDPKPDPRYERIYRDQQRQEVSMMHEDIQRNPNDLRYSLIKRKTSGDYEHERDRERGDRERDRDRDRDGDRFDARSKIEARRHEGWSGDSSDRRGDRRESPGRSYGDKRKAMDKTDLPDFKNRPGTDLTKPAIWFIGTDVVKDLQDNKEDGESLAEMLKEDVTRIEYHSDDKLKIADIVSAVDSMLEKHTPPEMIVFQCGENDSLEKPESFTGMENDVKKIKEKIPNIKLVWSQTLLPMNLTHEHGNQKLVVKSHKKVSKHMLMCFNLTEVGGCFIYHHVLCKNFKDLHSYFTQKDNGKLQLSDLGLKTYTETLRKALKYFISGAGSVFPYISWPPENVVDIPLDHICMLSKEQIQSMTEAQLLQLKIAQIQELSVGQLNSFTKEQQSWLYCRRLVQNLSPDQVKKLKVVHLEHLSLDQINLFLETQKDNLRTDVDTFFRQRRREIVLEKREKKQDKSGSVERKGSVKSVKVKKGKQATKVAEKVQDNLIGDHVRTVFSGRGRATARGRGDFRGRGRGEGHGRGGPDGRGKGEFQSRGRGASHGQGRGEFHSRGRGDIRGRGRGDSRVRGFGHQSSRGNMHGGFDQRENKEIDKHEHYRLEDRMLRERSLREEDKWFRDEDRRSRDEDAWSREENRHRDRNSREREDWYRDEDRVSRERYSRGESHFLREEERSRERDFKKDDQSFKGYDRRSRDSIEGDQLYRDDDRRSRERNSREDYRFGEDRSRESSLRRGLEREDRGKRKRDIREGDKRQKENRWSQDRSPYEKGNKLSENDRRQRSGDSKSVAKDRQQSEKSVKMSKERDKGSRVKDDPLLLKSKDAQTKQVISKPKTKEKVSQAGSTDTTEDWDQMIKDKLREKRERVAKDEIKDKKRDSLDDLFDEAVIKGEESNKQCSKLQNEVVSKRDNSDDLFDEAFGEFVKKDENESNVSRERSGYREGSLSPWEDEVSPEKQSIQVSDSSSSSDNVKGRNKSQRSKSRSRSRKSLSRNSMDRRDKSRSRSRRSLSLISDSSFSSGANKRRDRLRRSSRRISRSSSYSSRSSSYSSRSRSGKRRRYSRSPRRHRYRNSRSRSPLPRSPNFSPANYGQPMPGPQPHGGPQHFTGPTPLYGPPPGHPHPFAPPPGNVGPPFGHEIQYAPPPVTEMQYAPPPEHMMQNALPSGQEMQFGPPPGYEALFSPPPGQNLQFGPPPGQEIQYGPSVGQDMQHGPPQGGPPFEGPASNEPAPNTGPPPKTFLIELTHDDATQPEQTYPSNVEGPPADMHDPSQRPDFPQGPPLRPSFLQGPPPRHITHGPPPRPDFMRGPPSRPDFRHGPPPRPGFMEGPPSRHEFNHGPPPRPNGPPHRPGFMQDPPPRFGPPSGGQGFGPRHPRPGGIRGPPPVRPARMENSNRPRGPGPSPRLDGPPNKRTIVETSQNNAFNPRNPFPDPVEKKMKKPGPKHKSMNSGLRVLVDKKGPVQEEAGNVSKGSQFESDDFW